MLEQRGRGGIDFNTGEVDAGDNNTLQHVRQFFLVYIVLVEPYTDSFGIDFDQFGQRVLQAAGNRDGAALRCIERGKLLAGRL